MEFDADIKIDHTLFVSFAEDNALSFLKINLHD